MGLSSNQARFLTLTSRQIDLEKRVQDICQRRIRLSNDLEKVATKYNNSISDRRLYLNTVKSSPSVLNDPNNKYELLSAPNLYDNGLHLFMNGAIVDMVAGGLVPTGNVSDVTLPVDHNVGDWLAPVGSNSYKITSKIISPNAPNPDNLTIPDTTEARPHTNESNLIVQIGPADTTTHYDPDWRESGYYQNPTTGLTTRTFTRSGRVQTPAAILDAPLPSIVVPLADRSNIATSVAQDGAATKTVPEYTDWEISGAAVNNGNGTSTQTFTRTGLVQNDIAAAQVGFVKKTTTITEAQASANGYDANHIIHNATEFVSKINSDLSGKFILADDIDMSSLGTLNHSVIDNQFTGQFDGNGKTISNLTINSTSEDSAIFKRITGNVSNLLLDNININSTSNSVGALAGTTFSTAIISNIYGTALNISGTGLNGGLIGSSFGLNITNCSSSGSVSSNSTNGTGGIVGQADGGSIKNCFSAVNVSGKADTGGIVGALYDLENLTNCIIENCQTTGTITGDHATGGVAGYFGSGDFGFITNCSATGNVSGVGFVGGLVGNFQNSSEHTALLTKSYSTGNVISTGGLFSDTGGLVGYAESVSISNSYASGNVTNTGSLSIPSAGGLVGCIYHNSNITDSYASGTVTVTSTGAAKGGFIGVSQPGVVDTSNFYKNNMSVDGAESLAVNANVAPMPTGTWDNAIWDKTGSLPLLKVSNTGDPQHTTTTWNETTTVTGPMDDHITTTWTETLEKTDNPGVTYNYKVTEYTNGSISQDALEIGLRNGTIQLAKHADVFTQNPVEGTGPDDQYELLDWRTQPIISDDLFTANDADAETQYNQSVTAINAQDKKLGLEQTNVEIEYKAITTEKEAVNKIIDTNIKASFKYFG